MKKAYIIGVLLIVTGIGYLISASGDVSSYGTFNDALSGNTLKISGTIAKNKPIVYDPVKDANFFSFYMLDTKGDEMYVVNYDSKPQDFERSESLVITGKYDGEKFIATDILQKCPSKYKDQEVLLRENIKK